MKIEERKRDIRVKKEEKAKRSTKKYKNQKGANNIKIPPKALEKQRKYRKNIKKYKNKTKKQQKCKIP